MHCFLLYVTVYPLFLIYLLDQSLKKITDWSCFLFSFVLFFIFTAEWNERHSALNAVLFPYWEWSHSGWDMLTMEQYAALHVREREREISYSPFFLGRNDKHRYIFRFLWSERYWKSNLIILMTHASVSFLFLFIWFSRSSLSLYFASLHQPLCCLQVWFSASEGCFNSKRGTLMADICWKTSAHFTSQSQRGALNLGRSWITSALLPGSIFAFFSSSSAHLYFARFSGKL